MTGGACTACTFNWSLYHTYTQDILVHLKVSFNDQILQCSCFLPGKKLDWSYSRLLCWHNFPNQVWLLEPVVVIEGASLAREPVHERGACTMTSLASWFVGISALYKVCIIYYILIHPCVLGNRDVITKILTSPRQLSNCQNYKISPNFSLM